MKTETITNWKIIFIALTLLLSACKKETVQTDTSFNANNLSDLNNNAGCKSTQIVWGAWYTWDFTYNKKGLADTWTIDFGGGYLNIFKMKYDKFNRLASANGYDASGNLISTTSFTYRGALITSQFWADIVNQTQSTTTFTYNKKGEIVKEDDNADDIHYFLTYDRSGNCTQSNMYIGSSIYFSDNYEFKVPVINPLLSVSGIDFMFPFVGVGYFNKIWFSTNLSYVYDDQGNPYEINDLVATRKDFVRGHEDLPNSVNYYDSVSESPYFFTFGYSCDEGINSPAMQMNNRNKKSASRKPMIFGPPAIIKKQLIELRKQYAGK